MVMVHNTALQNCVLDCPAVKICLYISRGCQCVFTTEWDISCSSAATALLTASLIGACVCMCVPERHFQKCWLLVILWKPDISKSKCVKIYIVLLCELNILSGYGNEMSGIVLTGCWYFIMTNYKLCMYSSQENLLNGRTRLEMLKTFLKNKYSM